MATIVMSAEKVIEAAENTIKFIQSERVVRNEQMITKCIRYSISGRIRSIFGVTPLTRKQAEKKLLNDTWGFYPSTYAWGDLEKAHNLKRIAEHGDPVTLNEEDVRVLF